MGAKSQQGAPQTTNTGGTTASTVNTGPWMPQQPYLADAFSKAQSQYGDNAGKTFYPGATYAPLNSTQDWGMQFTKNVANQPTLGLNAANKLNVNTLNGAYLSPDSNPWLKGTFDQAGDAVTRQYMTATAPQTAGAMAGAGRYGSGAYSNLATGNQITLGKTMNDLATNIYGGNYSAERGRQMDAVGQVPGLMNAAFINPNAVSQVGDRMQAQAQLGKNDDVARFNYGRDQPQNALNTYLGQIQGNYGQSGVSTGETSNMGSQQSPYYTNPMASLLGGTLGIGSLFTGGKNSAASGIGSLFGKGGS